MKQDNNLLTQTEIAQRLSISKGTLSKWISKNNVSPIKEEGNKKLFDETIIETYKQAHKANNSSESRSFSTIEFLERQLKEKQEEINKKQARIEDLEKQLNQKNDQIYDLADKLATLADQAQRLNLADKKQLETSKNTDNSDNSDNVADENENEKKQETSKKGFWSRLFSKD